MAEAGTLCVREDVLKKTGTGVSGTSSAEAYTNEYILQAESYINCLTRINFTTSYATLNVAVKYILKEAASNLAAMYVMAYDTTGYSSRIDAENLMNLCWRRFVHCVRLLRDQKTVTFVGGA